MRYPVFFAISFSCPVWSLCECGFSLKDSTQDAETWTFTDVLETDFRTWRQLSKDSSWDEQSFNVSAKDGRGSYGKYFTTANIEAQSVMEQDQDPSERDGGLELRVGSSLVDNAIPSAELDTARLDLHWGSYRASMKVTGIAGTCAAFFWVSYQTSLYDPPRSDLTQGTIVFQ